MGRHTQAVHAAVLVVGVLLVGTGFVIQGQPEYTHDVDRVPDAERPQDADLIEYRQLSAAGQAVFDSALDSPEGTVAVPSDRRVPAFDYGDASGDHYVVSDGEFYRVTTGGGGVLSGANELVGWALLGGGVVAVLAGGRDLVRHRRDRHQ